MPEKWLITWEDLVATVTKNPDLGFALVTEETFNIELKCGKNPVDEVKDLTAKEVWPWIEYRCKW